MTKKQKLIFYLIISVLSFVYILLDWYGVFRKMAMDTNIWSIESYKKSYPKLEKADAQNKTVLSFNFVGNEKNFTPFIKSLLDQSVNSYDISMNIPYKDIKNVPEWVKSIVSVNGYSKDYGDGSALIYSVLREPEKNTKIILVESDHIYSKDFVQEIVEKSEENPDEVIYAEKGILVKPSFFDEKITDYDSINGVSIIEWLREKYQFP